MEKRKRLRRWVTWDDSHCLEDIKYTFNRNPNLGSELRLGPPKPGRFLEGRDPTSSPFVFVGLNTFVRRRVCPRVPGRIPEVLGRCFPRTRLESGSPEGRIKTVNVRFTAVGSGSTRDPEPKESTFYPYCERNK